MAKIFRKTQAAILVLKDVNLLSKASAFRRSRLNTDTAVMI